MSLTVYSSVQHVSPSCPADYLRVALTRRHSPCIGPLPSPTQPQLAGAIPALAATGVIGVPQTLHADISTAFLPLQPHCRALNTKSLPIPRLFALTKCCFNATHRRHVDKGRRLGKRQRGARRCGSRLPRTHGGK